MGGFVPHMKATCGGRRRRLEVAGKRFLIAEGSRTREERLRPLAVEAGHAVVACGNGAETLRDLA